MDPNPSPRTDPGFATCCVLSYDRYDFLKESLESMIRTAEYPMEIIVHDDGSPDRRVTMYLESMLLQGKISTLIQNPPGHNQGQGIALNRMFAMAKGDPIVKLDHDLIYHPGWLRKAVNVLSGNAQRAGVEDQEPFIGALGLFHYAEDPVDHEKMFITDWPEAEEMGQSAEWEQVEDFVGSAMVIPRLAFEELGPFEERSSAFAEDYEFKMKVHRNTEGWARALALMPEDVVTNQGFGLGPSTVVVENEHGLTSREIKEGPVIVNEEGD